MPSSNQITKRDAIGFMRNVRNCDREYVIQAILSCTLHGAEYPKQKRYGTFEMSYFCRAFNITEYDVPKQRNRIKGRYRKYASCQGIEAYLRKVLEQNWPGFGQELPRMDDLMAQYAAMQTNGDKVNVSAAAEKQGNVSARKTRDSLGYTGAQGGALSQDTGSQGGKTETNVDEVLGMIVGGIILIAVVVWAVSKIDFSGIIDFLWYIFTKIMAICYVGLPIITFFVGWAWKRPGRVVAALLTLCVSYVFLTSGSIAIGFMIWLIGTVLLYCRN